MSFYILIEIIDLSIFVIFYLSELPLPKDNFSLFNYKNEAKQRRRKGEGRAPPNT